MNKPVSERPASLQIIGGAAILVLAALILTIAFLSPKFVHDLDDLNKPIISIVVLLTAAGGVYLFLVFFLKKFQLSRFAIVLAVVIGILFRISMFGSTPILEDDHFRYLWDGGVLANGFNPYQYAPQAVPAEDNDRIPQALRQAFQVLSIVFPWEPKYKQIMGQFHQVR